MKKRSKEDNLRMDINEFREFGHAAIEFLVEYLETIRDRLVKIEIFWTIYEICDHITCSLT